MMSSLGRCTTALFLTTLAAAPLSAAAAQTIRGVVVDSASRLPLAGASVLLRLGDSVVASARSDSAGQFVLGSRSAGAFSVAVRRFGFQPLNAPARELGAGEVRAMRFEMSPSPVLLDTVRTERQQTSLFGVTSGQEWFIKHMREGRGMFLSGIEVLAAKRSACDYFANLPGLVLSKNTTQTTGVPCVYTGDLLTSNNGHRCLSTRVDRMGPISGIDSADIYVRPPAASGDTVSYTIPLEMVKGIEIYRNGSELPSDQSLPLSMMRDANNQCVWIQVWTEVAW